MHSPTPSQPTLLLIVTKNRTSQEAASLWLEKFRFWVAYFFPFWGCTQKEYARCQSIRLNVYIVFEYVYAHIVNFEKFVDFGISPMNDFNVIW